MKLKDIQVEPWELTLSASKLRLAASREARRAEIAAHLIRGGVAVVRGEDGETVYRCCPPSHPAFALPGALACHLEARESAFGFSLTLEPAP